MSTYERLLEAFANSPKKYKLEPLQAHEGGGKYRIVAVKEIPKYAILPGTLGGTVSGYHNLSQEGNCWITAKASVRDKAKVLDDALVTGNARVLDSAIVHGQGAVSDNAVIRDKAIVSDQAHVYGSACVIANARVRGQATVTGFALISGSAVVEEYAVIHEHGVVTQQAHVYGNAEVSGQAVAGGNAKIHGSVILTGNKHITRGEVSEGFKNAPKKVRLQTWQVVQQLASKHGITYDGHVKGQPVYLDHGVYAHFLLGAALNQLKPPETQFELKVALVVGGMAVLVRKMPATGDLAGIKGLTEEAISRLKALKAENASLLVNQVEDTLTDLGLQ